MGSTYLVQCKNCKKNFGKVRDGSGMRHYGSGRIPFYFPCLDKEDNTIISLDYFDENIKNSDNIVFYDHASMFIPLPPVGEIPPWKIEHDKLIESFYKEYGNKYYLPSFKHAKYYCPNCKEFGLSFFAMGCWD